MGRDEVEKPGLEAQHGIGDPAAGTTSDGGRGVDSDPLHGEEWKLDTHTH